MTWWLNWHKEWRLLNTTQITLHTNNPTNINHNVSPRNTQLTSTQLTSQTAQKNMQFWDNFFPAFPSLSQYNTSWLCNLQGKYGTARHSHRCQENTRHRLKRNATVPCTRDFGWYVTYKYISNMLITTMQLSYRTYPSAREHAVWRKK